ncbi:MAG: adenosyl-hopene transferase HpnH [Thermogutta sp.]
MRFPLSLTRSLSTYLVRQRLAGRRRFPLVLMLEPLFACNLHCTGCGRIREYADLMRKRLTPEECLAAARECGAPVVSICGGEPLIYPYLVEVIRGLLRQKRHIYLCTNGLLIPRVLPRIPHTSRITWNVHVDGMEQTHDAIVEKPGGFREAVAGIRAAKEAGFRVNTNTTIYRQTDMHEIVLLLEYLTECGVDGFLLSPSYPYEIFFGQRPGQRSLTQDATPAGPSPETLFLTRQEIQAKFASVRDRLRQFRLVTSPLYLDFLCGRRELSCAAWASPTRNVAGWKSPCYLITDGHYATFREWMDKTDWDALGPGRDPRCEHCMVHCGFETGAVVTAQQSLHDTLALAMWQFG